MNHRVLDKAASAPQAASAPAAMKHTTAAPTIHRCEQEDDAKDLEPAAAAHA